MKNRRFARYLLVVLVIVMPLIAGGCPMGDYSGTYSGPGYNPGGGYTPSPPFVSDTVIDLYLRVLDPYGYALPGCEIELRAAGSYYKSYTTTSNHLYPIHDEFPGEYANYNDAFRVGVNRYEGQSFQFDVLIRRWGFMTVQTTYTIPYLDRDTIYVFFDEIVMYP